MNVIIRAISAMSLADLMQLLKAVPESITLKMDPSLGQMLQLQKVRLDGATTVPTPD